MTPDSRARRIVVGYDGSPASRSALARAAERAGADGSAYIVHAYSLPNDWLGIPNYQQMLDQRVVDREESRQKAGAVS
jgi:nucleotide-binding universal stress UspA family protein